MYYGKEKSQDEVEDLYILYLLHGQPMFLYAQCHFAVSLDLVHFHVCADFSSFGYCLFLFHVTISVDQLTFDKSFINPPLIYQSRTLIFVNIIQENVFVCSSFGNP